MKLLGLSDASKLIESVKTVFFDCDGVLWNNSGPLPKAVELISKMKMMKKQVFFVTNNSLKSREGFLSKFIDYGFDVNKDQVLSSAYLAAVYIQNIVKLKENQKVYMIGPQGLVDEFDNLGIRHIGFGPRVSEEGKGSMNYTKDPDVGAVVVGYDEHFNLQKVDEAMQYLLDPEMPFVATNLDNRFPITKNVMRSGTGVIVKAVMTAAERDPIVVGKPNRMFLEIAQTTCDIDPAKSLMIGDRLNTDITFGKNCGFQTLCVLTGVTDEERLKKTEELGDSDLIPDFYSEDHADKSIHCLLTVLSIDKHSNDKFSKTIWNSIYYIKYLKVMEKLTPANTILLSDSIKTVFFDVDGVLWNGTSVLPKSKELVDKLKKAGKQVFFVTNNNGKSRDNFLKRFQKYDFDVKLEEVFTSSYLAAYYVHGILRDSNKKKVYMIGSEGIRDELDDLEVQHIGFGPRTVEDGDDDYTSTVAFSRDPDIGAVVVGYDKYFCMNKVCEALNYLDDPLVSFVGTNMDNSYPLGNGVLAPGTGVCIDAIVSATERKPIIVGKPSKMFFDVIRADYPDIIPEKTLMVGDRLDTDIAFGRACGFKTLLVLSGVTSMKLLEEKNQKKEKKYIPDYYSEDLTIFCDGIN